LPGAAPLAALAVRWLWSKQAPQGFIPALKEAVTEDVEPSVKEAAASALDEIQKGQP
jgi:hypothetical protein